MVGLPSDPPAVSVAVSPAVSAPGEDALVLVPRVGTMGGLDQGASLDAGGRSVAGESGRRETAGDGRSVAGDSGGVEGGLDAVTSPGSGVVTSPPG